VAAGTVADVTREQRPAGAPTRGLRVLEVPGLPAGVEVRASPRRRRTVTAYREGGRTVVLVPARMSRADVLTFVRDLVGRLEARERRSRPSDAELARRARALSTTFLEGRAVARSVRWVDNQHRRWGSCTPLDGTIRLSSRLQTMPAYVIDYVLLHELAHLLVPGHGPDFQRWLAPYPRLLEAQAFLAGVDHVLATGPDPVGDPGALDPAYATGAQDAAYYPGVLDPGPDTADLDPEHHCGKAPAPDRTGAGPAAAGRAAAGPAAAGPAAPPARPWLGTPRPAARAPEPATDAGSAGLLW
jgi:predicted metal-dependent hydrolase